MKRLLFLLLFGFCIAHSSWAQVKIGDNPQNIDAASVLELESTDKVLVITRVTTTQMNAIFPLQGAMVYNTDVQSVHYFDGAQWINIGGGGGGTGGPITADPIVNDVPTIVITPTGTSDNLEVAENSIGTLQIADGGVNGTLDIQDGSIGPGKLQDQSVTQEKLSENSVGAFALDNDNIGLEAFSNANTQFISAADIVSGNAGNALQIGTDGGAFYDETLLMNDIQNNTDAINNIGIPNLDAVLQEGNNALNKKITGLAAPTDPADAATKAYVDGLTGGGGSTEVVDGTTLIGAGTPTDQFRINPSATVGQYLRTTAAGVVWDNIPAGTGTPDLSEVLAEGTDGGAALIKNILDPEDPQDAATRAYVDAAVTGGGALSNGTILIGDATDAPAERSIAGDATLDLLGTLTIATDAVNSDKIANASIMAIDLNDMDADDGEVLKWDDATTSWITAADDTGTAELDDGFIFVGDASDTPQGVEMSGDATIDNTGELTIADDAIELNMIAQNGATTDGQIIQWSNDLDGPGPNTDAGWEVADNAAGHLGNNENNIFFAGPGGVPFDTEDTTTDGDNGGLIWDPTQRFASGALYVGFKAQGNSGGADSQRGDFSKLAVAERLNGSLAFPIQMVNEGNAVGSSTGILFANDANGNAGGAALVLERVGGAGQGDFHFLASATGTTAVPSLADKVLSVENDGDVVLTGNLVDKNNIGATPPAMGATEDGYVLTNTPGGTVWAPATGGSGETNTGSNLGTAGVGPFIDKNAADLRFKTINGLDADIITVTDDIANNEIDLDIKNGSIPFSKLEPATPTSPTQVEQVLVTSADGTAISWQPRSSAGTNLATDNLQQDAEARDYDLNGQQLVFSGSGNIGIGNFGIGTNPAAPDQKLHILGEVRSQGFNSSFGSQNAPAFSFASGNTTTNDSDTGMWRDQADELVFSAGGEEGLRLEENGNDVSAIVSASLELQQELIDVNNDAGTNGQVLSSTGTGIDWVNASGGLIQKGKGLTDASGQLTISIPNQPNTNYIINLTVRGLFNNRPYTIQVSDQQTNQFTVLVYELDPAGNGAFSPAPGATFHYTAFEE